jgi:ElaB/YqjD/DUF883 family membrane-anchored ribosome-binding protein
MEKVIKKALGYFKPKENEDFTHVIFTEKEYDNKEQKIRDLENNITKLEREYNAAVERYKKSANDKIAEIQAQADQRIDEALTETRKQKKEAEKFENMNTNLIRVAIERANAKRGLTPKKEHSGYIFLSVEDYTFYCECKLSKDSKKTKTLKFPCFRLRLQSPYEVSFDLDSAKSLIYDDLLSKLCEKCGFTTTYKSIVGYTEDVVNKVWSGDGNFTFKVNYKANFQKGYWEVEYLSRDMPLVPPDMMVGKSQK